MQNHLFISLSLKHTAPRPWPVILFALCAGLALQAPPAHASKVALNVQVSFELRDLRHQGRYDSGQQSEIVREVTRRLVAAASRRFPHVQFTDAARPGQHLLECVFNTGANVDAPRQTDTKADAVSFHFRFRGPGLPTALTHSWGFEEVDRYWDAIPDVGGFLKSIEQFLGDGIDPTDSSVGATALRAAAEGRFASLFDAVFSFLPVFTDREIVHVAGTRLLVIKAPREDYQCSFPDLSEFHLRVDLADPLGPQHYDFRTRLLNPNAFRPDQPRTIPPDLRLGLVTEAVEPLEGTARRHLDRLTETPAVVDKSVYLLRLGPVDQACLETAPSDFQPTAPR